MLFLTSYFNLLKMGSEYRDKVPWERSFYGTLYADSFSIDAIVILLLHFTVGFVFQSKGVVNTVFH